MTIKSKSSILLSLEIPVAYRVNGEMSLGPDWVQLAIASVSGGVNWLKLDKML